MDSKKEVFDVVKIPVYKEKLHGKTTPIDEDTRQEKIQYNAGKQVAAIITKIFHIMIESGFRYSYIANGEALVLLRTRWEDPPTLHYHQAAPSKDVGKEPHVSFAQTAVGQSTSVSIMDLGQIN